MANFPKPNLAIIGTTLAIWLLAGEPAGAVDSEANTVHEVFAKLKQCWTSPALPSSDPGMEITVLVAFNRKGEILGRPKITYESPDASDEKRLQYRIAVAETLQRCTPMSFTEGLAGAIAGHPFRMRFDDRRRPLKPLVRRI